MDIGNLLSIILQCDVTSLILACGIKSNISKRKRVKKFYQRSSVVILSDLCIAINNMFAQSFNMSWAHRHVLYENDFSKYLDETKLIINPSIFISYEYRKKLEKFSVFCY